MDQETAQKLFGEGAVLVILDMPLGTEFGIDYNSWNTGPNFRGVKMIPPGVHFVYYSAVDRKHGSTTGPRSGFFHVFERQQIVVRKWNTDKEELVDASFNEEDMSRVRAGLQELDRCLGAYPFDDTLKTWFSLTSYITPVVLACHVPECGMVTSVPASVPLEEGVQTSASIAAACRAAPHAALRLTDVPAKLFPPNATPLQRTKCSLDRSYTLDTLLAGPYGGDFKALLGEVQFSFVCFLIGQVFEGFEQWKQLVALLCGCDDALQTHSALYLEFLGVLHFQLRQTPEDFFVDIVSHNNFLVTSLQGFFTRLEHVQVDAALARRAASFKTSVTKHFQWDFDVEPDDEQPVIVDECDAVVAE